MGFKAASFLAAVLPKPFARLSLVMKESKFIASVLMNTALMSGQ